MVIQIFVFHFVHEDVKYPFYFTFASVPFSQLVIFKIYRWNQLVKLKSGLF